MMTAATDTITSDQLVHELDQLYVLGNTIELAKLEKIQEIARRQAWREDGARSMTDWLAYRYGKTWSTAKGKVELARALSERPRIASAFRSGRLSADKVVDLCSFVPPEEDGRYAHEAQIHNAAQVKMWARHARRIAREDAERVQRLRYLRTYWDRREEFLEIHGRIPGADGAMVNKTLERVREQLGPDEHGIWPPADQAKADALVELVGTHVACDADADRATIVVHVDDEALTTGEGTALIEDGPPVPAETARRLACDGRVEYVWHASDGTPIGVGRRRRVVPPWMLRMLKKRDAGCVACGRVAGCQAHHVEPWTPLGPTDLDNLVLLCRRCHRLVHEGGFRLVRDQYGCARLVRPDGRPVMNRPAPLRPDIKLRIIGPPARTRRPTTKLQR